VTLADIIWFCSAMTVFTSLVGAEFRKEIPHAVKHFLKLASLPEFKAVVPELPPFPDQEPVLEWEEKVSLPTSYHRLVTVKRGADEGKFKLYPESSSDDIYQTIRKRFKLNPTQNVSLVDQDDYDVVVDGTLETGAYKLVSADTERKESSESKTYTTLYTGAKLPFVGLGTWKSKPGEVGKAVEDAIDLGYRHIDCAAVYGNEKEIGEALAKKIGHTVQRENLFIVSKLWNSYHQAKHVEPAIRQTLKDLQLDSLDLYLIHWPLAFEYAGDDKFPKTPEGLMRYDNVDIVETWKAMEALVEKGLTKAIGLSNFNSQQITRILKEGKIKPACLQIESHPYLNQEKLINFAFDHGIKVVAYSPLGSSDRPWAKAEDPKVLQDQKIARIAKKYDKTPAQVILRFQVQRGVVVIPKSVNLVRISQNRDVFDFVISDEDMNLLKSLNLGFRLCIPCIVNAKGEVVPVMVIILNFLLILNSRVL